MKDNEDLDIPALKEHSIRLAKAGLVGLVALGSNGEAVHMSTSERKEVITAVREALDSAGYKEMPVIAGCSEHSTRGTIQMCIEAQKAGASHALILAPSYYRGVVTDAIIHEYFTDVADASPIPILLYNYPGAVSGIDMNSDLMIKIARHANVVGAKFTCGNTGKLMRVAKATDAVSAKSAGSGFIATGGFADMTVQTAVVGGSGTIIGTANVLPKLAVKTWELYAQGHFDKAVELQKVLSQADWILASSGISGTKGALAHYSKYAGLRTRKPLPTLSAEQAKAVADDIADAWAIEESL